MLFKELIELNLNSSIGFQLFGHVRIVELLMRFRKKFSETRIHSKFRLFFFWPQPSRRQWNMLLVVSIVSVIYHFVVSSWNSLNYHDSLLLCDHGRRQHYSFLIFDDLVPPELVQFKSKQQQVHLPCVVREEMKGY